MSTPSLSDIRSRISAAQQEETRNNIIRERAQAERDAALASLKEEFNVATVQEAVELRKKLKKQQEAELEALAKELDKLGA